MASGTNPNDISAAGTQAGTHTGDLNAPDNVGAHAGDESVEVGKSGDNPPKRFLALETAFIDRIFGGSRRAYEADYPDAKHD